MKKGYMRATAKVLWPVRWGPDSEGVVIYASQVPAWAQLGVEAGGALRWRGVWRKGFKTVRARVRRGGQVHGWVGRVQGARPAGVGQRRKDLAEKVGLGSHI